METKRVTSDNYKIVVDDLLEGKVVGFPTETVYGLAIIYDNKESFDNLYILKNRSITKPISMMVSNIDIIKQVAYVDDRITKVINAFMPGSITIILKAKENLPEHVTFNYKTVGIRIPSNKEALDILNLVNKPLLVTSANISGESSLVKADDVYNKFNGKISSLIDANCVGGVASTVVDLVSKPFKILREGPISYEDIKNVIGE